MHTTRLTLALTLSPLALALVVGGCKPRRYNDDHHNHVEYLNEFERNDLVEEANDLGVLVPGDRLVIEGSITDIPFDPFDPFNGHDPFDGFAFVSNQPIHVEFRLISHNWADLDLCVYDPVTDQVEFCFETASQPEVGAVDVFAAGTEFHLVIESFQGSSGYDLEIEVFPLYGVMAPQGSFGDELEPISLLAGDAHANLADFGRARGYIEGRPDENEEGESEEAPRESGVLREFAATLDDGSE